jgi:hypothetical protein
MNTTNFYGYLNSLVMKHPGLFFDYQKVTVTCCLLLIFTGVLTGCRKNNPLPVPPAAAGGEIPKTLEDCSSEYTLLAGQFINAGTVTVTNDDDSIYVTYTTTGGWVINETHLYVGAPSGIPVTGSGNPIPGQFPYTDAHNGVTSVTYAIPINPNLNCYAVAAHASLALLSGGSVVQTETGWSDGQPINQTGNWATYSTYCLLDCEGCEFQTTSYNYFAGQNILIGTLDVTNDEQYLYVTYHLTGNWYLSQTHLYVGPLSGMPKNSQNVPLPGQFPYVTTHNPLVQTFTYTIPLSGLSPCYVIAAHADVKRIGAGGVVLQTETGWSFGTRFPGTPRWGWVSNYCTQECEQ